MGLRSDDSNDPALESWIKLLRQSTLHLPFGLNLLWDCRNWVDSPRSPSFIFFNLHQQPVGAHPRLRYMWRRSWERPLRTASKTDAKLPKPRSLNSIEKKIKWINREELRFIYIKPNRRRRETIKNSFDCRWLTLQNRLLEKRNRLSEHKIRSIIDRKFYTD